MDQHQTQRRKHYQLWGSYFMIGSLLTSLMQWFAIPHILISLVVVLYSTGMLVLNVISQPSGTWHDWLPEMVWMLALAALTVMLTYIMSGDMRYLYTSIWLVWGVWLLTRSVLRRS
ncbi:MAG: hypothetical protein M3R24_10160 [Chloroflexota bacterium]|nr:hypothetical protein [Chloroflexota bacterium]